MSFSDLSTLAVLTSSRALIASIGLWFGLWGSRDFCRRPSPKSWWPTGEMAAVEPAGDDGENQTPPAESSSSSSSSSTTTTDPSAEGSRGAQKVGTTNSRAGSSSATPTTPAQPSTQQGDQGDPPQEEGGGDSCSSSDDDSDAFYDDAGVVQAHTFVTAKKVDQYSLAQTVQAYGVALLLLYFLVTSVLTVFYGRRSVFAKYSLQGLLWRLIQAWERARAGASAATTTAAM